MFTFEGERALVLIAFKADIAKHSLKVQVLDRSIHGLPIFGRVGMLEHRFIFFSFNIFSFRNYIYIILHFAVIGG